MDKLFEQIESLRKKPAHVRRRVLYISTGILSSLVFFVWLSILPSTLDKVENRAPRTASAASPFASLMGTITEGGKSIMMIGDALGGSIQYMREQASSSQRVSPTTFAGEATSTIPIATSSENEAGA